MKTLVVLSGGMDSTVALGWAMATKELTDEVATITFNYGSKHNDKENEAARYICGFYKVKNTLVHLPFVNDLFKSDLLKSGGDIPEGHYADESMKRTVVPFRNGIMLSIAAGFAESIGATKVVLGNHVGDHAIYPDCRKEFSESLYKAIEEGTYLRVKLSTPFGDINKTQICKLGESLKAPLYLTYSCYNGGKYHCGKCGTCVERKEAFRNSGVLDQTNYDT